MEIKERLFCLHGGKAAAQPLVMALPASFTVKKQVLKTEFKKKKKWARSCPLVGNAKYLLDLAHLSRAAALSFASGTL